VSTRLSKTFQCFSSDPFRLSARLYRDDSQHTVQWSSARLCRDDSQHTVQWSSAHLYRDDSQHTVQWSSARLCRDDSQHTVPWSSARLYRDDSQHTVQWLTFMNDAVNRWTPTSHSYQYDSQRTAVQWSSLFYYRCVHNALFIWEHLVLVSFIFSFLAQINLQFFFTSLTHIESDATTKNKTFTIIYVLYNNKYDYNNQYQKYAVWWLNYRFLHSFLFHLFLISNNTFCRCGLIVSLLSVKWNLAFTCIFYIERHEFMRLMLDCGTMSFAFLYELTRSR
jgi:hypothetical protein